MTYDEPEPESLTVARPEPCHFRWREAPAEAGPLVWRTCTLPKGHDAAHVDPEDGAHRA